MKEKRPLQVASRTLLCGVILCLALIRADSLRPDQSSSPNSPIRAQQQVVVESNRLVRRGVDVQLTQRADGTTQVAGDATLLSQPVVQLAQPAATFNARPAIPADQDSSSSSSSSPPAAGQKRAWFEKSLFKKPATRPGRRVKQKSIVRGDEHIVITETRTTELTPDGNLRTTSRQHREKFKLPEGWRNMTEFRDLVDTGVNRVVRDASRDFDRSLKRLARAQNRQQPLLRKKYKFAKPKNWFWTDINREHPISP